MKETMKRTRISRKKFGQLMTEKDGDHAEAVKARRTSPRY